MANVMLLDCTLRDGGYVNDWNFGHNNLTSVFERVVDAGVDIIEIGFLDERRGFDINHSIMPDTDSVYKIYGDLDKKNTMVVGMIDYGACQIENIKPQNESFLDGIRVIFKKHIKEEAMEFCLKLKSMGYKVFSQLVSLTSYSDKELIDFVEIANRVKPYAVSMVDTYGLMHQDNLQYYFNIIDKHLDKSIGIGYHAHNNFQMGYANCIKILSNVTHRTMIVDGSIYGMGKSAGNAPLELIAMHLNNRYGKNYNVSQILEAIDSNITQFYSPATWGYNMFYYIAASNDCHPNYVSYLMDKKTLSVSSINDILSKLSKEKKLNYDRNYIDDLYWKYQHNEINDQKDIEKIKKILTDKKILIMGPGATVSIQKENIVDYINLEKPLIISINYIPDYLEPDYIFLTNSKRYVQLSTKLSKKGYKIIATSNVTGTYDKSFDYVLNFSSLIDEKAEIIDNSLIMLLKLLISIGVEKVMLAGFDGYSYDKSNYINTMMEYDFIKNKIDYLNNSVISFIDNNKNNINIQFLTKSLYEKR
ncbi:hypothetical protein HMPREF9628_01104 [Peptoanaerobacter stomatis]|uniref:Pyruvate carboxyltransferase domain-containing protein n=1 Tax=Peptoanaerobacter stomatis TaxID=796937 RepID=G9XAT7_9FIRM|nr:aldolase catalytic domain-containing protein [Peptoanaerobacter stomatis]EHL19931.1 hypothetical protein HMPREF9628_01104 [Peptoanaerobacter stomatis]